MFQSIMDLSGVEWPKDPVPGFLAEEDPLTDYCPGLAADTIYTGLDLHNEVPGAKKNQEIEYTLTTQNPEREVQKEKIVREPIVLSEEAADKKSQKPIKRKKTAEKSEKSLSKSKKRKKKGLFDF